MPQQVSVGQLPDRRGRRAAIGPLACLPHVTLPASHRPPPPLAVPDPLARRAAEPAVPLRWQPTPWAALDRDALYAALQLRSLVFVVEQRCPFLDLDGADDAAEHLLGWTRDADGHPLLGAYARLYRPGIKYAEASIGRVVSHPAVRRTGAGRALMREALDRLVDAPDALAPGAPVRIGAQLYLERFYASFGFARASAVYDEDGIDHVEMERGGTAFAVERAR